MCYNASSLFNVGFPGPLLTAAGYYCREDAGVGEEGESITTALSMLSSFMLQRHIGNMSKTSQTLQLSEQNQTCPLEKSKGLYTITVTELKRS